MTTYSTKPQDIKREWRLFDAEDKILGRLATEVAQVLMGKNKVCFTRHLDMGDFVVVINAKKVKVSGKKETGKIYYRHTGYSTGLRATPLGEVRKLHPERIIEHAVSGMLPKNKLRDKMMARLKVFAGEEHSFADKF